MAKSDNWSTPPDLIKVLRQEFKFTLEVCAAADNRAMPDLPYMGLDNGLDAVHNEWGELGGFWFCNPPYSELPFFTRRAADMYYQQRPGVLLIPAYTDTNYWWDYINGFADVRFLKGRLKFWLDGKPGKDTARFPSAIVVYQKIDHQPPLAWYGWDWKPAANP